MAILIEAVLLPIDVGLKVTTNVVVLAVVIGEIGSVVTEKSVLPVRATFGVPVRVKLKVPVFSTVNVLVIGELTLVDPKSVKSVVDGVISPSAISTVPPFTFILILEVFP